MRLVSVPSTPCCRWKISPFSQERVRRERSAPRAPKQKRRTTLRCPSVAIGLRRQVHTFWNGTRSYRSLGQRGRSLHGQDLWSRPPQTSRSQQGESLEIHCIVIKNVVTVVYGRVPTVSRFESADSFVTNHYWYVCFELYNFVKFSVDEIHWIVMKIVVLFA